MINDQLLLESLHKFYEKEYNRDKLFLILSDEKSISLRSIDWFITNYSKKNNTYYIVYEDNKLNPSFNEKNNKYRSNMNVFHSYKSQLKSYSKRNFDPFCRRNRVDFNCNGENISTTIGQLNFFRWAIDHLVIEYIILNYENIETDMNDSIQLIRKNYVKSSERKKRQELSLSASRGLNRHIGPVVITFD